MLLYVCAECGAWEDKTLTDAWAKAFQPLGRALARGLAESYGMKVEEEPKEEPVSWPCPADGNHGPMRAVSSEDRLFIQPAIIETSIEPISRAGGDDEKDA